VKRERAVDRPLIRESPGWGYLLFDSVVFGAGTIAVTRFSRVVATIGDRGVGHGPRDILITAAAIAWVLLMALEIVVSLTVKTPPASTRAEELEERRAWLADLREQGAPWPQRLAHRLSLAFVAAPIMGLRRGLRSRPSFYPARTRVHHFCYSVAGAAAVSCLLDGLPWGYIALTLVLAVVVDLVVCWWISW
jgi:hypothetical protein